jgi:hypothetical protein
MSAAAIPGLTPEQVQGIVERRQSALLEKWMHGKASDKEQAEIAHLIAQIRAGTNPAPDPASPEPPLPPTIATPAAAADPFTLEDPAAAPTRRTGYLHPLAHYAAQYAHDTRTIKRWMADGKAAQPHDPPPLDDPAALPAWWTRRKRQRVPDSILAAAQLAENRSKTSSELSTDGAGMQTPKILPDSVLTPTSTQPRQDLILANLTGDSLADQVRNLRRTVSINFEMLNRVLLSESPDENSITIRQRNYERSLEQLRKIERTEQENRLAAGELVTKADVRADLGALLSSLAAMRTNMAEKIAAELPWLSGEQRHILTAAIERVRTREDDLLRSAEKWTPAELPELLAA